MVSDESFHNAWDCPSVKDALGERMPDDIMVAPCGECRNYSYYNQGSHFSCSWCDWSASGAALDGMIDAGEVITLDEYTELILESEDAP